TRRVVEHGFVDVDDDRGREARGIAGAILLRQRIPVLVLQRGLQAIGRGAIHGAIDQVALDRALVPRGGVEGIVGGRFGLRGGRRRGRGHRRRGGGIGALGSRHVGAGGRRAAGERHQQGNGQGG